MALNDTFIKNSTKHSGKPSGKDVIAMGTEPIPHE